jgi:L-alanine-DL-glutamate epimerase-like enolase superfamily enzyme
MDAGACDICRIDVGYGGLTACLRLAQGCRLRGAPLEIHTGGHYHLQVLATCPDELIKYYETFGTNREERTKPGRATPGPVADEEGYMHPPRTPGMGVELDWDYIEAHRLD